MSPILNPTIQQPIARFKILASLVPEKTVTQKKLTELWKYGVTDRPNPV